LDERQANNKGNVANFGEILMTLLMDSPLFIYCANVIKL
jgi:hypothetical protein